MFWGGSRCQIGADGNRKWCKSFRHAAAAAADDDDDGDGAGDGVGGAGDGAFGAPDVIAQIFWNLGRCCNNRWVVGKFWPFPMSRKTWAGMDLSLGAPSFGFPAHIEYVLLAIFVGFEASFQHI